MKENKNPALSRLLLPVNDPHLFGKSIPLIELISRTGGKELEKVELIHVISGSFLTSHLNNIDFRAGHVLSSELMGRLRKKHYEDFVDPTVEKVQDLLKKSGVALRVEVRIEVGDPAKKICTICEDEGYSTLIMARKAGDADSFFGGTVLYGILHRYLRASVYIVGEDGFPENRCPVARVMIGIDGSEACLRAVREAALLLSRAGSDVEAVALVSVMDPVCLIDERSLDCQEATMIGNRHNDEAVKLLVGMGVPESRINAFVLFGNPGEVLTGYAESFGATMCYIGRHDRSKIAEVFFGSVCGEIVHRCRKTAVVLVC
jgi:nucleotide-binding universal stress UspA family protein